MTALLYHPDSGFSRELDLTRISDLLAGGQTTLWLDLEDPTHDEIEMLRREFGFHELALEDAVLPHQRPKVDEYNHFYFLAFYSVRMEEKKGLEMAELDLFVGPNFLVGVHRSPIWEIAEGLRRWQRSDSVLGHGVGSLVYSLLDSLVDGCFDSSDQIAERVAELESRILEGADQETVRELFGLKKQLLALRRILGPERDVLAVLMRQDLPLLDEQTLIYLRDVYDHLVRITDTVDLHSDLLTNALDVHLSSVSNRLNQVMKTLTGVTIILMTMALIAGIYGMNFKAMPELEWEYGYPFSLGLMVLSGGAFYILLRRKGWL